LLWSLVGRSKKAEVHVLWVWATLVALFCVVSLALHYVIPFKKAVPFKELWDRLLIDLANDTKGHKREVFLLADHAQRRRLPYLDVVKRTGQLRTKQRRRSSGRSSIGIHGKSIEVLPFPLDFARAAWHAHKFLPHVEKEAEWLRRAASLLSLADKTTFPLVRNNKQAKFSVKRDRKPLFKLLKEATGISNPCTYQRLEFFGDAVLGYFLSVNLMSRNSSLKWDFDELSNLISDGGNNSILYEAALRCGVGDFVVGRTMAPFKNGTPTDSLFVPQRKFGSKIDVGDKKISDLAESLLGMAYLYDRNGKMVVGLLNGMCVPLPYHVGKLQTDGWPWFSAMGPCIKSGFPFSIDKTWQRQLVSVGTSLYCKKNAIDRLEGNFGKLVDLCTSVSGRSEIRTALSIQSSKIMLMCALFDDSLRDTDDSAALSSSRDDGSLTSQSISSFENSLSDSTSSKADSSSLDSAPSVQVPSVGRSLERGIYRAAMLRDTLSLIGLHALRLCVSEELVERYPDANEGDLTMLRCCVTNDDVLAYIMAKAGIHELLFDQTANSIARFLLAMKNAERQGEALWKERGGWIVRGGSDECIRRWQQPSWPTPDKKPRYVGLARGRLFGRTRKLTSGITGDLVFSFKAIIGALVLAVGLDGMWLSIGPLLEETMLLSAEEVRMAYPVGSSNGRT